MTRQNVVDLLLVAILACIVVLYSMDAYNISPKTNNLLLIFPVGIISLIFLLGILAQTSVKIFKGKRAGAVPDEQQDPSNDKKSELRILSAMALLAVYVLSLSTLGFDIATFLFIGLMLFLQGERRLFWLIGFPLLFSFIVSQFFTAMIPYPMPMAIQMEWISGLI